MSDYGSDDSASGDEIVRRPSVSRNFYRVQAHSIVDLSSSDITGLEKRDNASPRVVSPGSAGLAAPIASGFSDSKRRSSERPAAIKTFNLETLTLSTSSEQPFGSGGVAPMISQRRTGASRSHEVSSSSTDESDSSDSKREMSILELGTAPSTGRRRPRPLTSEFEPAPRSSAHTVALESMPLVSRQHGRSHTSDLTDTETTRHSSHRNTSGKAWKAARHSYHPTTAEPEALTDTEAGDVPALTRRKKTKYFEPVAPTRSVFTNANSEGGASPRQQAKKRSNYEIAPRSSSDWSAEVRPSNSNSSLQATSEQSDGGTVEQLISHFIYGVQDLNLVRRIILAKESFTSSASLLALLIEIFDQAKVMQNASERSQVQIRVINFVKKWLSTSPDDFEEIEASSLLDAFLDQLILAPETETWSKLLTTCWKVAQTEAITRKAIIKGEEEHDDAPPTIITAKIQKLEQTFRESPHTINAVSKLWKSVDLEELNLEEFARQWTLLDHKKFSKIKFRECVHNRWEKADLSPHVADLNKHFNRSTRWIGSLIVKEYTPKKRAKTLTTMIALGEQLLAMRNYFGAMAVIIGISQSSITRLSATWGQLSSGALARWKSLEAIGNPVQNFKALRALQETATAQGTNPFLLAPTLLFRDLLFIEDGNEDWIDKDAGLLNWDKVKLYGRTFESIHLSQINPYPYKHILIVQKYISHFHTLSEDEIMAVSKTVEPSAAPSKASS